MADGSTGTRTDDSPGLNAGRTLVVVLVCLLVWTLLSAPRMNDAADAHPPGARRTAALIALAPFAALSDASGLSAVTDSLERAVGVDPDAPPGGTIDLPPPDPLPDASVSPIPDPPSDVPVVESTEPIRTPAFRDRLRIVIVGDSLAAGVGNYAGRVFRSGLVVIERQGRVSSGLARPDYFDWFRAMGQIAAGYDPDLVIVMIGENDNQNLQTPSGRIETLKGTTDWPPAYQERAETLMRIATAGRARVVWVGLPVQRDRSRWTFMRRQNDLFERASKRVGDVAYLDSWALFDDADGGYTAFYRAGGRAKLVRESDGLHFTPVGYTLLVRSAAELATDEFGLDPRSYGQ